MKRTIQKKDCAHCGHPVGGGGDRHAKGACPRPSADFLNRRIVDGTLTERAEHLWFDYDVPKVVRNRRSRKIVARRKRRPTTDIPVRGAPVKGTGVPKGE